MPRPAPASMLRAAALGLALLPATSARADEAAAEACVEAKVRESYAQGWSVRTTSSATLGQGEREIYALTLHTGNTYRVMACADQQFSNVDVVIYDGTGTPVGSDPSQDREPVVEIKPTSTGKYYVAVFASGVNAPGARGGVATAVTYK